MKLGKFLLILLGISIVILLIFGYFVFVKQPRYATATVPILKGIDENKINVISANPDLIFDKVDWNETYILRLNIGPLANLSYQIFSHSNTGKYPFAILGEANSEVWAPWYCNSYGFYYEGPLPQKFGNKKGIVVEHPPAINFGVFIAQNVTLKNKSVLVAEIANLADFLEPCSVSCSDAVVKIKITDTLTNIEERIYEDVLDSRDGWKIVALDISKYDGKNITFKIEVFSGGPCGEMCGEWLAIDRFYVGEITT